MCKNGNLKKDYLLFVIENSLLRLDYILKQATGDFMKKVPRANCALRDR